MCARENCSEYQKMSNEHGRSNIIELCTHTLQSVKTKVFSKTKTQRNSRKFLFQASRLYHIAIVIYNVHE